ncbi:hypothetical protein WDU94_000081 [Cyamophila willieti]
MPRRKKKNSELLLVGEDVKIAVNLILKNFIYNSESKEYEFPSCYNNVQRAYVHELAKQYGLKSKSRGKGSGRYLTVYKRDGSSIIQNEAVLCSTLHGTVSVKGSGRYLTVYKRDGSSIIQNDAVLCLSPSTLQIFNMVLSQCPVTVKDRNELLPLVERDRHLEGSKELALLNKAGVTGSSSSSSSSSKMYSSVVQTSLLYHQSSRSQT